MSPVLVPPPLPECAMCERPTRREVHARNAGLCSECARALMLARQGRYIAHSRRTR